MIKWYALLIAAGYLVGSIPLGLYAARYGLQRRGLEWRPRSDQRRSPRPVPAFRIGPEIGGSGLFLELLKGFAPTFTGYLTLGTPGALSGGSATLFGHSFPLFGLLRGSNSLAPFLGVLLAVYPLVVVTLGMVWAAALAAWRYASLAALVAAAVSPLALAALDAGGPYESILVGCSVLWALLTFFAHRENIRRLVSGREARINAPTDEARPERRVR